MCINRNTIFYLKGKKVFATEDINIDDKDKGLFILNFWEQCDYYDTRILPTIFVHCETKEEEYVLRKNNIILGDEKDICLARIIHERAILPKNSGFCFLNF